MLSWMTAEVPSRPLGLARIIIGAACAFRAVLAWPTLQELAKPETFRVPYVDWLPEPSPELVVPLVVIWFIAGLLFALGWRVGLVGPVLMVAIALNLAVDQQTYDNHVYLMAWLVFLLTMGDAGAGMSARREDRPVVRWPVVLVMLQLSVVYGFGALTKLNAIFLSGAGLAGVLSGGVIPFPDVLRTPGFLSAMAVVVVFIELFIAIMIWRPRFRPAAFISGLLLHAGITLLMESTTQLLIFSLLMLALYPLFLDNRQLLVDVPEGSSWRERIELFDLLRVIEFGHPSTELQLTHHDETTRGADAHTRILEHLVPWLWVAPFLRMPGFRQAHRQFFGNEAPVETIEPTT